MSTRVRKGAVGRNGRTGGSPATGSRQTACDRRVESSNQPLPKGSPLCAAVLLLVAATFAGRVGPIRSVEPADLLAAGVSTEGRENFRPIRPFGSVVVAPTEEIIVTADDPFLHYPNGETVRVDLGDTDSMTFVRTVWKSNKGDLSVDYGLPTDSTPTVDSTRPL